MSYEQEACREQARNVGREDPTREWICTNFDSWERNPYYVGPPGRHPEDDHDEDSDDHPAPTATVAIDDAEIPF